MDIEFKQPATVYLIADPAPTGREGAYYINAIDSTLYFFYDGSWQTTGIIFTPADSILQENGDYLLQEAGTRILKE